MEILQTDDKLRQEILSDAKKKAERILKKAKKQAADLEKSVSLESGKFEEEFQKNMGESLKDEIKLIFSTVDIEVKKKNLAFISQKVGQVFDNVENRLLEKYGYEKIMLAALGKTAGIIDSKKIIIETGAEESLGENDILKSGSGKVEKVTTGNFKSGIKVFSSDRKTFFYLSLSRIKEKLVNDHRTMVYEMITGNEAAKG